MRTIDNNAAIPHASHHSDMALFNCKFSATQLTAVRTTELETGRYVVNWELVA